jgi:hypothetical protein
MNRTEAFVAALEAEAALRGAVKTFAVSIKETEGAQPIEELLVWSVAQGFQRIEPQAAQIGDQVAVTQRGRVRSGVIVAASKRAHWVGIIAPSSLAAEIIHGERANISVKNFAPQHLLAVRRPIG